ncbi:DoxX family protein [Zhongshania sp.]|uniref:HvfX family Cu-binding RiPP maturation protein n=1 Tax=Zhongshania sp. TaxID=1971902 RepID=UPI00356485E0
MLDFFRHIHHWQNKLGQCITGIDGLPALGLRLYLVPVFWMAGSTKMANFAATAEWFGNNDWGLGLPFPAALAFLATATEVLGAALLLLGLATRWIAIPLSITMVVAAISVHWQYGWQAIADNSAPFANARVAESADKLAAARSLLETHGNYDWLTSSGNIVVLNNGIEFAATYLLMLLALIALGGGRYVSADYWLGRIFARRFLPTSEKLSRAL